MNHESVTLLLLDCNEVLSLYEKQKQFIQEIKLLEPQHPDLFPLLSYSDEFYLDKDLLEKLKDNYLQSSEPFQWKSKNNKTMENVKQMVNEIVFNWDAPIRELLENTSIESMRFGPLYDRDPQVTNWNKELPIAFIGDALHPMTPFKGQGANRALDDAVVLAELIFQFYESKQTNLKDFLPQLELFHEQSMKNAKRFVLGSRVNTFYLHTPEALINPNPNSKSSATNITQIML